MDLKLGLKKDEVLLVPHTSEWNAEFTKIKQQIQKHTQIALHSCQIGWFFMPVESILI